MRFDEFVKLYFTFMLFIVSANFFYEVANKAKTKYTTAIQTAKQMEELHAQCQSQLNKLEMHNETLAKLVEELANKVEELEIKVKQWENKELVIEYALSIGVPIVANLKGNYNRQKLLLLIQHGSGINPRLHIQQNQELDDGGLFQDIVDLLATVEKPEKMIRDVVIEYQPNYSYKWPQSEELKLKQPWSNVLIKFNEASANPTTYCGEFLAEYRLINKNSHFQVLLYYFFEQDFNKWASKFVYRRLE